MSATEISWPEAIMNIGIAASIAGVFIVLIVEGWGRDMAERRKRVKMNKPPIPPKPVLWTSKTVAKRTRPWDS